ncbi:unnamed protein product [Candida verbasci]|uniref:Magnesium transporter MgtE intracellular domain-containing protein n=1 Tax=Candida verbasci TaxID=1227364 RepID=A0A9W4TXZ6_9ASCO|nr:unnamed protein product [Candida verbasci]
MRISKLVAYTLLAISTTDALFLDWSKIFGQTSNLPAPAQTLPIGQIIPTNLPQGINAGLDIFKASANQLNDLLQKLNPEQITDFFSKIPGAQFASVLAKIPAQILQDILSKFTPEQITEFFSKIPGAQLAELLAKIPQQAFNDFLQKFSPEQIEAFFNKIPGGQLASLFAKIPAQIFSDFLNKLSTGQIADLFNKGIQFPLDILSKLDPTKFSEILEKIPKPLDLLNLSNLPVDANGLKDLINKFLPFQKRDLSLPTDPKELKSYLEKEVSAGANIAANVLSNVFGFNATTIAELGLTGGKFGGIANWNSPIASGSIGGAASISTREVEEKRDFGIASAIALSILQLLGVSAAFNAQSV